MSGVEERIAELESRLAFQDDTLQALNDEVVRQQRDIERLQLLVSALSQRQAEMQTQIGVEVGDEAPPPHY
ncbi:MAG TPA: SlyX family protein [Pseudomonas sp.]|nr:SlyX family protein [Pseudomonas sp.]